MHVGLAASLSAHSYTGSRLVGRQPCHNHNHNHNHGTNIPYRIRALSYAVHALNKGFECGNEHFSFTSLKGQSNTVFPSSPGTFLSSSSRVDLHAKNSLVSSCTFFAQKAANLRKSPSSGVYAMCSYRTLHPLGVRTGRVAISV
jgi:hypothetical protein